MLRKFKKYIQSLSLNDQLHEVNEMIDYVDRANIGGLKKIKMIIVLKQIKYNVLLFIKRKKSLHTSSVQQNIIYKISPKCCNEDSFMYPILRSLRMYTTLSVTF